MHRNGCYVQLPFAPMELDLSRLSCPCLFGTCWPSAQSARALVAGIHTQGVLKMGVLCLACGTAQWGDEETARF